MPRIEIEKIPAQQIASYPREFAAVISGREKQRIGDAAGLTQFGVNVTRIKAGSASALRHWHEQEDEFIYMRSSCLRSRGIARFPTMVAAVFARCSKECSICSVGNRSSKMAM